MANRRSEHHTYARSRDKFYQCLRDTKGIISDACGKCGIATKTYYAWKKRYPEFARQCDAIQEEVVDWVETQLYKKIEKNDTVAILFYLKCKAKARGYVERQEQAITVDNATVKIDID